MLYGVVIAGGSGTRFWPESRKKRPKQLLRIDGDNSLLRATVDRILGLIPVERVMVVTVADQGRQILQELPELSPAGVILEPYGRNTAPCIALSAYKLAAMDPQAIMLVLPADHIIGNISKFLEAVEIGALIAESREVLITFGIQPTRPETGYGYIRTGDHLDSQNYQGVYLVDQFVEKPDRPTAEAYLDSGKYLWNSGMFMWRASTIIRAFERHLPDIHMLMSQVSSSFNTEDEADVIEGIYRNIQSVSIDNGIMEIADNVAVIPLDVAWNDVGSWPSLHEVWGSDSNGNSCKGHFVQLVSRNCVISASDKLVALVGVEDLIVVDTPDAILVCHKDAAQQIKKFQEILPQCGYGHLL